MSPRWELAIRTELGGFRLEVDLDCSADVLALYGPSGAGKSTVVECLAGVRSFDGHARLNGRSHQNCRVGWVPQEGALDEPDIIYEHAFVSGAGLQRDPDGERRFGEQGRPRPGLSAWMGCCSGPWES